MSNKNTYLNNCKEQCQITLWSKNMFFLLRTLTDFNKTNYSNKQMTLNYASCNLVTYSHKQQILCIIENNHFMKIHFITIYLSFSWWWLLLIYLSHQRNEVIIIHSVIKLYIVFTRYLWLFGMWSQKTIKWK